MTAFIIGVPPKWLDNLLSRHRVPGVMQSSQGVERQISDEGILAAEVCRILNLELGLSLAQAAAMASAALQNEADSELHFSTASGLKLTLPLAPTRARLRERMLDASETVARRPRGRPRKHRE